jgi:hypothetical protein
VGGPSFVGREVEITARQLVALRALMQESDPAYAPVGYVTFGLERMLLIELHKQDGQSCVVVSVFCSNCNNIY